MNLCPGSCVHIIMIYFLLEPPSLNCINICPFLLLDLISTGPYEIGFNIWIVTMIHLISPLHVKEFNVKNAFISPDKLARLLLLYFFSKVRKQLDTPHFCAGCQEAKYKSKKDLQLLVTITLNIYLSDCYKLGLFFHFFFICLMIISSALCPLNLHWKEIVYK